MTEKEIASEELHQLLEKDKATRLQKCRNELDAILKKHNCELISVQRFTVDGRIIAEVHINILS